MAFLLLTLLVLGILTISHAGPEYDFEQNDLAMAAPGFFVEGPSKPLSISRDRRKGGERSLLWEWGQNQDSNQPAKLFLDLKQGTPGIDLSVRGDELKKGGLKFWMYHDNVDNNQQTKSKMQIVFHGLISSTSPTDVDLNFKGWRAVWIGYAEFFEAAPVGLKTISKKKCKNKKAASRLKSQEGVGLDAIRTVEFHITSTKADKLHIDLVRFVPKMNKQTRDFVVKQVSSTTRDQLTFYDEKDFWQMSLRWCKVSPTECTATDETPIQEELDSITKIETRLENWYATDEQISLFDNDLTTMGDTAGQKTSFKHFQNDRWQSLLKNIKNAHSLLEKILTNKPSLFSALSELGKEENMSGPNDKIKFGYVFTNILLPVAMEYSFRDRKRKLDVGSEVGDDVINDDPTLQSIHQLLLYVQDQGWAEGSGLGTLAHEMNKSGAGFMHSMFLLRNVLKRKYRKLFEKLIKAMKWYNDFNEIYQKNDYIYDGTTADRMRTILFYRLMIILMGNNDPKKQVRDMKCFRNWVQNILKVNKGLGGVIKPDYTGFHHKTFYGSAYVPQALHNAALVQYLLDGTSFALNDDSKGNLRKVLEVSRAVAVKYSTPNSLCGRMPRYDKAILAEHVPAYAYISYVHKTSKRDPNTEDKLRMFLRLTESLEEPDLKVYLENGQIQSSIHYWNTIGSLDILDQVKAAASSPRKTIQPEKSPKGHWSKNFAALSVHRREDWSVAAKGFNRYTWDYEKSDNQNIFGVFHSHGSLQISNSEASLKAYDVDKGWDWTRIPGATTVNIDLDNFPTEKARNYNPGRFAGGVSLIGSVAADSQPQNGAFGMSFKKPKYKMKTNKASPLNKMKFKFKKSYFFYDHLIVCVGSDINLDGANDFYAQTTLFQDKLVDPFQSSTISINGKTYDLRLLLKDWKSNSSPSPVLLTDTHGNKYQVNTDQNTVLKVKISDQESRKSDGCVDKTKARYATAWLMHKTQNKNKKFKSNYEYAILIKDGREELLRNYRVKRIKNKAHAVRITPTDDEEVYGYAIFRKNMNSKFGPVKTTDLPCMIMTKKVDEFLYLSISNPSLTFKTMDLQNANPRLRNTCMGTNRKDLDEKGCPLDIDTPLSSDDVRTKLMFCVEGRETTITVTLNCDFSSQDIDSVKVDGKDVSKNDYIAKQVAAGPKVQFLKLVDGFTTEIRIRNCQTQRKPTAAAAAAATTNKPTNQP